MNKLNQKRLLPLLWSFLAILLILAGTYIFFDNVLFNDNLISNRVDGRLNTFFAEHWFQVFRGREDWMQLPCFYPTQNVLSYSDIMLGFSLPYSLFRLIGINMYVSFKYAVITIHFIGSITLWYFMQKCLKCSQCVSLIAVVCFSFSNGYYAVMANPQMIAESLIPVILICLFYYVKHFHDKKRFLFAFIGLGIFILLFYTAFYVAYFTCVFLLLFLICFCLVAVARTRRETIFLTIKKYAARWREYLLYLALCILSMVPFLCLYLPSFHTLGGRSWEDVLIYAPTLYNLVGEHVDNFLGFDPTVYHLKMGFSPIYLGLHAIFIIWYVFSLFKNHKEKEAPPRPLLYTSLILCCMISLFLMIAWEDGFSLWYFFFKFVPGASAIRGISRWLSFLVLPLAICFSLLSDECLKKYKIGRTVLLPVLLIIVFICNHSSVGVCTDWNSSEELAFIESVPAPPIDCEVIYLTDKTRSLITAQNTWELQMDAWAIAQAYDLKTVNGYSGQLPEHWDLLVEHDDIDQKVADWMRINKIDNVVLYSYDLGTHEWTRRED